MLFRKSFSWDYSDIAIKNPYSLIGYINQPIYIYNADFESYKTEDF